MSSRTKRKINSGVIQSKKARTDHADQFLELANRLNLELEKVKWLERIGYVYNPTIYAREPYETYVRKYCCGPKNVMFLGMNPGPWGMSQTGVPFGEVQSVKDWLKINGKVEKPKKELPSRPIQGFDCTRVEVSGQRFWGLMKELCVDSEVFFKHSFVYNYLPLQFIDKSGKNLPPTLLKNTDQKEIFSICNEILKEVINLYQVEIVVGVGKFAEERAKEAVANCENLGHVKVVSILHPSPRSKAANNWRADTIKHLNDLHLMQYLTPENKK